VARIEQALETDAPAVRVAGAAYHGLGIAACVQNAEEVALRTADELTVRS
jgi:protoporphyrinogen oxidase